MTLLMHSRQLRRQRRRLRPRRRRRNPSKRRSMLGLKEARTKTKVCGQDSLGFLLSSYCFDMFVVGTFFVLTHLCGLSSGFCIIAYSVAFHQDFVITHTLWSFISDSLVTFDADKDTDFPTWFENICVMAGGGGVIWCVRSCGSIGLNTHCYQGMIWKVLTVFRHCGQALPS